MDQEKRKLVQRFLNPFALFKRKDINLNEKWWHRLVIVFYILVLIIIAVSVSVTHFVEKDLVAPATFNINVTETWSDYVEQQSEGFSDIQKEQYNTYRASGLSPEAAKELADKPSFSAFVLRFGDGSIGCFSKENGFNTLSSYGFPKEETLTKKCDGESSIVKYQENWVYHVQGILYILLMILLSSVMLQFLYYKVFMYVVYGSTKED